MVDSDSDSATCESVHIYTYICHQLQTRSLSHFWHISNTNVHFYTYIVYGHKYHYYTQPAPKSTFPGRKCVCAFSCCYISPWSQLDSFFFFHAALTLYYYSGRIINPRCVCIQLVSNTTTRTLVLRPGLSMSPIQH